MPRDPLAAMEAHLTEMHEAFASATPAVKQRTRYTCGVASLQAVLLAHGVPVDERELREAVGSTPARGSDPQQIANAATTYGLKAEIGVGQTVADLRQRFADGWSIILDVQAPDREPKAWDRVWDQGHYVVVAGITPTHIRVMDPSRGTPSYLQWSNADLEQRWHDYYRVAPRGGEVETRQLALYLRPESPLTKGKRKDGVRTHIPAPKTERGRQSAQARGYRPPRSGSGDWVHVSVTPRDERLPAPPPPPKAPKPKPAATSTTGAPSIEALTAHARRDRGWGAFAMAALAKELGREDPQKEDQRDFHRELAQELVFAWEDAEDEGAKAGLAQAMLNMGLRRIGEAGEVVPFDGIYHETQDDLLPGDPAYVVTPGWKLDRGTYSRLLGRAHVSATPPAPAATERKPAPLTDAEAERRITEAISSLDRLGAHGAPVSIVDVRKKLPDIDKETLDHHLFRLGKTWKLVLHQTSEGELFPGETRAALLVGPSGRLYNVVSIRSDTSPTERKPAPWTGTPTDAQLTDFAAAVQAAAERAPADASPLDPNEVLISHVWRQMKRDGTTNGLDAASFKTWLAAASRDKVTVTRLDNPRYAPVEEVRASAVPRGTWEFHNVRVQNRRRT